MSREKRIRAVRERLREASNAIGQLIGTPTTDREHYVQDALEYLLSAVTMLAEEAEGK